jgi:hypothetical protein
MYDENLHKDIVALLREAGIESRGLRLEPCDSGGNNCVVQVYVGERRLIAKRYFTDPADSRDRMQSESAFLEYAQKAGIQCVPKILIKSKPRGIALFEYVDGSEMSGKDLCPEHILQAQEFFVKLNDRTMKRFVNDLPNASEACFSISAQLDLVSNRIERLATIRGESDVDKEAIAFAGGMQEAWESLRSRVLERAHAEGIDIVSDLPLEHRCVSPSDFGFHNALVNKYGQIVFIDFEYAGWDDPAKTISDFFSHPAVSVPREYFEQFGRAALQYSSESEQLMKRTLLLLPVFQMKWCGIVMNDFIPHGIQRRMFANSEYDVAGNKRIQLEKAQHLLQQVHV